MGSIEPPIDTQKDVSKPLALMPSRFAGIPDVGSVMDVFASPPMELAGRVVVVQHLP
jgi:hypothetical protein